MSLSHQIWPFQSHCVEFYGQPGNASRTGFDIHWLHANVVHVACPWVLTDGRNHFGSISVHRKCSESLARVLAAVWEQIGKSEAEIIRRGYNIYSGSGNYRAMRTDAERLSMHAFFAAIDWDAPQNPLHSRRHKFTPGEPLFECFRAEGWACGIDWQGNSIDSMHVQAARVG